MRTFARNFLAFVLGFLVGSLVNMGLIKLGPMVFPMPPGFDPTTPEGLKAAMPLMQPEHFLFPFLAHALGTFVGALVACRAAASHGHIFAWVIGGLTLLGGIAASLMFPAPLWFKALDLTLAYLPMTWLAIQVGRKRSA
jgi:hypothetical protein